MVALLVAVLLGGGPMVEHSGGASIKAALETGGGRAALTGTLERVTMGKGGKSWLGTALVLDDGTVVWLSYNTPPKGWEPLLGKFLRVEGTLAGQSSHTVQSLLAPHLNAPGTPVEVKRPLTSLVGKTVRLSGVAENAKGGAVLLVDGTPLYVAGRDAWGDELRGKRVSLGGRLVNERYLPEATVNAKGEISQGVEKGSTDYVLRDVTEATPL